MRKLLALTLAGAFVAGAGILAAPQEAKAQIGVSVGVGPGWGYWGPGWRRPYVAVGTPYYGYPSYGYGAYPYYGGYPYYGAPVVTRRVVVRGAPSYYVRPRVVSRRVVYRGRRW